MCCAAWCELSLCFQWVQRRLPPHVSRPRFQLSLKVSRLSGPLVLCAAFRDAAPLRGLRAGTPGSWAQPDPAPLAAELLQGQCVSRGSRCAPCFAVSPAAMFWPHSMSWAPALRAGVWAPSPAPLFGMLWGSGKPRGGWWGGCRGVSAHMGPSAPACSPPSLQHIPSLTRFLPPIPFFRRCVASAAVSCPSSCFVAPAILTTRLTIYPDGAGLLLCAWHAFSIYKFCAEAERTEPNKLCELS